MINFLEVLSKDRKFQTRRWNIW